MPPQPGGVPAAPAGTPYGYPQGGSTGEPGYGYPQAAPQSGYGYPGGATPPAPPAAPPTAPPQPQGAPGFPSPGGGFAPGQPQGAGVAFSIGDIAISGDTIMTPSGPMPLKGAIWTATDMSRTEEKIPTHAIVLGIVFFFFCLLGLLFLLMKERVTTGFVQVTVASGGRHHATMVPVQSRDQVMYVLNQVNHARSLSL
ncbi:hypothetical protein [Streptomyces benahoarensis]|uniref:Uncharacterized protein n=1 Tax=Streptomyces benahoarensis TaxID=2595054 RepID=A0A553ZQS3_9ACTN|nr:hypothetical protein [Streptomyces benahoarensis]TSB32535.1 hypothetical protein FNJ62_01175 [Streptomyces benahoarensis]TSB43807.1 hypothetical protein FNZ23_02250 [Streptomyces benahoarensis]